MSIEYIKEYGFMFGFSKDNPSSLSGYGIEILFNGNESKIFEGTNPITVKVDAFNFILMQYHLENNYLPK